MPKVIMIVDDEPVNRELASRKLQEKGYDIMTASDGEDALKKLAQKVPDLILLDVQMPNMNGYAFIMEKSKIPAIASIPVIVLSSYSEMAPLFKRHGVRSYLIKPLNLPELLAKVEQFAGAPS
jgi:twitching motility two-component system response regulator PilH